MALAHFRMLVHELLNEDPDMVPKEAPLIVLDSQSAMFMAKNGKDTKHTRHMEDFLYKTIKGASFGTMSGSSFNNSWTNILKFAKAIPAVYDELY